MRLTMLVPAKRRDLANREARDNFLHPDGTDLNTFRTEVSRTGLAPATHYISCWGSLSREDFERIRDAIARIPGSIVHETSDEMPSDVAPLLTAHGLRFVIRGADKPHIVTWQERVRAWCRWAWIRVQLWWRA